MLITIENETRSPAEAAKLHARGVDIVAHYYRKWDKNISVLNLDGYREADSRLGNHEVKYLLPTIRNAVNLYGAFVLYYNTDLDSVKKRKRKASDALLDHTSAICDQLSNWIQGRYLEPADILTEDLARKLDEGYVGSLGEHYYVYRGNRHRMANLKLVFR